MTDDLYDPAPAEPKYKVENGRYRFPAPPGYEGTSWMRMTNLASAFSDQEKLQDWMLWKTLEGLRSHDVIFDEWMAQPLESLETAERKSIAKEFARKAMDAARADEGHRRGTARHTMVETYLSTGEVTGTRSMRLQMDSFLEALDAHDLEPLPGWTERRVWNPIAGGTMGTLDMGVSCRRTGQIGILDLKTQARFWTWQEICGQQYGYDSAPYVWHGPEDERGFWKTSEDWDLLGRPDGEFAGKRVALVAHMPQAPGPGQLPVEIYEVDLEYGRRVLECAACNVELRSIGRSVAEGRRVGAKRVLTS